MKTHTPDKISDSVLQGQGFEVLSSYISSYIGTLKVSQVELDSTSTRYIHGGSGTPIIFLHGVGATKAYFRSLMKSMANQYQVFAPDVPGLYPQVQLKQGKHNFRTISQWLKEFTTALGIERYILVGNSLSANLSAYHAFHHPQDVEKLCLMSFPENFDDKGINMRTIVDTTISNMNSLDDVDKVLELCFYNPPSLPNVVKRRMLKDALTYQPFIKKMLDEIYYSHTQLLSKLGRIHCPTLILCGDYDPICPVSFAEKLERIIPNAELHVLERSKHVTFVERHRLVDKLLKDFFMPVTHAKQA